LAGFGEWAGLSLEVGAIMAGLSLGSSIYQSEISSRLRPLRDFFIALFFIILGSEMNITDLESSLIPGVVMAVFVLVGNPFILYLLYRRMKFTRKNSFYAGLTAAQVSEFGFVFLFIAGQMGYVESGVISVFTVVALVTIFVSSYLITYNHQVYRFIKPALDMFGEDKHSSPREIEEAYEVLVFGYHRLGWKICEALKEMKVPFAVVDNDPRALEKLSDRGVSHFFGDASEVDFLSELPLEQANLIISTLPDAEDQISLIRYIRMVNQDALIIANLAHIQFRDQLYEAGADYVLIPHLVSGQWMADILKRRQWNRHTFRQLSRLQKHEMKLRFNLGHH
jgi:FlaA1/EpsC-like NDP-sugar epimerase